MAAKKTKRAVKKVSQKEEAAFRSPKGMPDILPEVQVWWERARNAVRDVAELYSFLRIDTPILEDAKIYESGLGAESEVVNKQMYILRSGGDRLALRPEGTAGIVRAYFQNALSRLGSPARLYYFGPMFRHEQPQAGRFRQFHQAGFEIIGAADPVYDAQIILVLFRLLERLGVKNLDVQVNTIGCRACRPAYLKRLKDYYKVNSDKVCRDCRRRLETNILRVLDCKNENCGKMKAGAPIILNFICAACKNHFKKVLEFLDEVSVPYTLNNYLVRGLDYYIKTVFEIFTSSGDALASGGRYDYLAETLKGKPTPGVGGAAGIERIVETLRLYPVPPKKPKVFFVHIGETAKQGGFAVVESLRRAGIIVSESFAKESLKSQLRQADKEQAALALIFGQKEVFEESVIVRDMRTGAQESVPLKDLIGTIKKKI